MTTSVLVFVIFFFTKNIIGQITYSSDVIWGTNKRPSWSNTVDMGYIRSPPQILTVEGIIIPCSTTGRPSAPNPYNGYPTGTAYNLDKGHIMALSNGGPDVSYNIVPQAAQWQRTGGWRKLEIAVYDFARDVYGWSSISHASEVSSLSEPSVKVIFHVDINLNDYDDKTGEPLVYNGWVKRSNGGYIKFNIRTGQEASWTPCKPSLSCQGFMSLMNMDNGTNIVNNTVVDDYTGNNDSVNSENEYFIWIYIGIGGSIVFIFILIGYVLWKKYKNKIIVKQVEIEKVYGTTLLTEA